ncbi:hypothetical protein V9L05_00180 [Bernardetia sp. Wsw4-3y2]|uniref:hypothetical protein n=1 Tax=Bernardetia sp. Wsw4-3y2 TaxID=3127471 RepID=UPI0030CB948C
MNKLLGIFVFVIFLLFTPVFGFAQSQYAEVTWHKPRAKIAESKGYTNVFGDIEVVGTSKSGISIIMRKEDKFKRGEKETKYFIESYNSEFGKIKIQELQIDDEKESYNDLLLHNDKLLLFTSSKSKKGEKDFLYMQEFNKSTLAFIGEKKRIVEVDLSENPLPSKYSMLMRLGGGNTTTSKEELARRVGYIFKIKRTNDSSNVVVTYKLPVKIKDYQKIHIALFDKNLELKAQKVNSLPYSEKEFDILGYDLDEEGTTYIKGIDTKKETGKIFSISNNLSDFKEYSFPFTKEYKSFDYVFDEKNAIKIYGVYSKYLNLKDTEKGIFHISINRESGEIEKNNSIPFEDRFQKILSDRANIVFFIKNKDGSILMSVENKDIRYSDNSINNSLSKYTYRYKDVIVFSLNKDAIINWSTVISKRQFQDELSNQTIGDQYISFYQQKVGDKLYLIFPDHADNKSVESAEDKIQYYAINAKVAMLAVVAIDLKTGEAKKEKIYGFLPKKDKEWIIPHKMAKISETEALIYAEGYDTFKVGKITFKP